MSGLTAANVCSTMDVGRSFSAMHHRATVATLARAWTIDSDSPVIMKLAAKLILIFLAGVLGIVTLFAWQTVSRQHAWEQERFESHAGDLVDAVTPAIEKAYKDGGTVTIQEAIEVSSQTVAGSHMRWLDGKEVQPQTKTTARKVSSVSVTNADGTRTSYSYVPLTVDGSNAGVVEVSEPMTGHDAFMRGSFVASLLSLFGVTILSAVVIYFGGVRLVGRPLDKLIEQVNTIGDGQLAQPPVLTGKDEFGKLAAAISQMSHRLSQQRETIRHADRLGTIGTLAAGVAHELGTPLNVVSGRAGLIAGGKLTAEEIQSSARTIKSESERMTAIIRQLLDFARQAPAPHESIDLKEIVTRTIDLIRPLAGKSRVEIAADVKELPVFIQGDAAQVQQVLTNLITNAIAAMPDGGTVSVTLLENRDTSHACLKVTDTGIGINSNDLQHIFEPFYTTKDVGQGTGLGLSIAYGIVKEHGGEIKVHSDPGNQTTFEVAFPQICQNNEKQ
jgi:two-component system NtrC family sensor kinase